MAGKPGEERDKPKKKRMGLLKKIRNIEVIVRNRKGQREER